MKKKTMSPPRPQPEWHREYKTAPKVQYGKNLLEKTTKNGPPTKIDGDD